MHQHKGETEDRSNGKTCEITTEVLYIHMHLHSYISDSSEIMRGEKKNIFFFQMFEESVDTRQSLYRRVIIAAFILFVQGRSEQFSRHQTQICFLVSPIKFCLMIHIPKLRPEQQRRSTSMDLQLQHQSKKMA